MCLQDIKETSELHNRGVCLRLERVSSWAQTFTLTTIASFFLVFFFWGGGGGLNLFCDQTGLKLIDASASVFLGEQLKAYNHKA